MQGGVDQTIIRFNLKLTQNWKQTSINYNANILNAKSYFELRKLTSTKLVPEADPLERCGNRPNDANSFSKFPPQNIKY